MAVEEPRFGAPPAAAAAHRPVKTPIIAQQQMQQKTEAGWTLNFCFIFITGAVASGGGWTAVFTLQSLYCSRCARQKG